MQRFHPMMSFSAFWAYWLRIFVNGVSCIQCIIQRKIQWTHRAKQKNKTKNNKRKRSTPKDHWWSRKNLIFLCQRKNLKKYLYYWAKIGRSKINSENRIFSAKTGGLKPLFHVKPHLQSLFLSNYTDIALHPSLSPNH